MLCRGVWAREFTRDPTVDIVHQLVTSAVDFEASDRIRPIPGLMRTGQSVTIFQLALIPGLLQHPNYRRATIRIAFPDLSAARPDISLQVVPLGDSFLASGIWND